MIALNNRLRRGSALGAALCFLLALALGARAEASRAEPERLIALTFDDGPTAGATDYLLAGLRARGVQATFFLCGYRMEAFPALPARIAQDGHELAVHGFSHEYLHTLPQRAVERELSDTAGLIAELSGCAARAFRPPGGLCSDAVRRAAEAEGLFLVLWNVDPHDWDTRESALIARRILRAAKPGCVVLLHDLYRSSADAAFAVIDALRPEGWEFVTVSELAARTGSLPAPGSSLELG